ncbi:MAG: hypothetical protein RL689_252 [Planctomycetota bacterium]
MIGPGPHSMNQPSTRSIAEATNASRRGTILVGILVGLVLLASALMAVAISGRREQDLTMRRMESMRASYAEEAAAQIAVRELVSRQDDDGDFGIGSVAGGNIASGIIVGSSRAAATAAPAGTVWTVQPMGSNGLSNRAATLSLTTSDYVPGLFVECFSVASPTSVMLVNWNATPTAVGIAPNVNFVHIGGQQTWAGGLSSNYAMRYRGLINIPAAGLWTFSITSDDGSMLWINGSNVIDNDGIHTAVTRTGQVTLPAGVAFFDLRYFQSVNTHRLVAWWSGPTVPLTTLIPPSAFTCDPTLAVPPVVGVTSLSLAGSSLAGYFSKSGAYGGGNITTDFSVQTNATTAGALAVSVGTLSGNAFCGVGGTPSTVITTSSGGAISGTRTAATSRAAVLWQTAPLDMLATSGALNVTSTTTINTDRRYSSITLNTANARLVISGHRVVRCDGNFTIGSNSTLEIAANSSLRLYMTAGTLSLANTSQVNANTADPTRLHVFFTAASLSMTMAGSATFHGSVFNPGGGLTMTGGSTPEPTFFGVFHGNTMSTTSTALFRADASFGSTTANTNLLTGWRQTQ